MADTLKKGNIEDFTKASENGRKIELCKKDFSKEVLKNINISSEESMIAMCSFIESNFLACIFEKVNFVKCDFSNADMFHVTFKNCQFNECSFNSVNFNNVTFDETCRFNTCTFDGIDLTSQNSVIGVDPVNFKVIVEMNDPILPVLINLGFREDQENDEYQISEGQDEDCVSCHVLYDPEESDGMYRCLVTVPASVIFTFDLPGISKFDLKTVSIMLVSGLNSAKKKISNDLQAQNIEKLIEKLTK